MKPEVGVMGGRAGRLGMQAPLEAGNEKETNPLSPSLGSPKVSPPDNLDIVRLISDMWPPELEENTFVFF